MTPDIKRELRKAGQCFQKSTKDRIFFYDLLCLELKPASDRPLYVAYVCGGSPAQVSCLCLLLHSASRAPSLLAHSMLLLLYCIMRLFHSFLSCSGVRHVFLRGAGD